MLRRTSPERSPRRRRRHVGSTVPVVALVTALQFLQVACATPRQPTTAPEPPEPPGRTIVVQPGDTLRDIAADAGLTVDEIVEVNGLHDPDDILAGQTLFLPATAPSTTPEEPASTPSAPLPAATALVWPVDGIVLRDFARASGKKPGYDGLLIAAPAGTPVRAAAPGVVAFAGTQHTATGVFVVVESGDLVSVYAHLKSAAVKEGQTVAQGEVLGEIGASGLSGVSPRLQFQVRKNKAPIDPLPLLPP